MDFMSSIVSVRRFESRSARRSAPRAGCAPGLLESFADVAKCFVLQILLPVKTDRSTRRPSALAMALMVRSRRAEVLLQRDVGRSVDGEALVAAPALSSRCARAHIPRASWDAGNREVPCRPAGSRQRSFLQESHRPPRSRGRGPGAPAVRREPRPADDVCLHRRLAARLQAQVAQSARALLHFAREGPRGASHAGANRFQRHRVDAERKSTIAHARHFHRKQVVAREKLPRQDLHRPGLQPGEAVRAGRTPGACGR